MHRHTALQCLFALGALACGPGETSPMDAPTWHEDIRPVFEATCTSCHTAQGGISGIPLNTYEDALAWREPIAAAVAAGTMPPWRADTGCADYEDDFSLSPDDLTAILAWAAADGPEGDPSNAAPTAAPWTPPTLERVDRVLLMPEPFAPTAAPDDYRCVILDWTEEETVWVSGYNFLPGNTDIVHHVIPFIIPPEDVETFRALDEADPGEGYTCYGGPGGDIDSLINARWLGGWAPGGGATVLPAGYGLQVEAGSIVVMQVHYNIDVLDGQTDQSGLEIQFERTPLAYAEVQPWTDVNWVLGLGMDIPAGGTAVEHTFSHTFEDMSLDLHSATLHMHTLGQTATLSVLHADGSESCLLSHSDYDFNWQREYWLTEPVTVQSGDTLQLSCTWDNPTDETVAWGDGTGDEMCLGITLLTPHQTF